MFIRTVWIAAAVGSAWLPVGSAQAATIANLTEVTGTVLVDSGNGFVPVVGPVALKVGDRVSVAAGGRAVLDYFDCDQELLPPSMTTVEEVDCKAVGAIGVGNAGPAIGFALSSIPALAGGIDVITKDEGQAPDSPTGTLQ